MSSSRLFRVGCDSPPHRCTRHCLGCAAECGTERTSHPTQSPQYQEAGLDQAPISKLIMYIKITTQIVRAYSLLSLLNLETIADH